MSDAEVPNRLRLPGHRLPKLCAYCGNPSADSVDHVPPDCIFPRDVKYRVDLITVPACEHCNNRHSQDDEFLLMLLNAVPGLLNKHPGGKEVADRAIRALDRASDVVQGQFRPRYSPNSYQETESGILVPTIAGGPQPDEKRTNGIFRDQIRALHYWVHHARVSAESRVAVIPRKGIDRLPPVLKNICKAALNDLEKTEPVHRGEGVFSLQWGALLGQQTGFGYLIRLYGTLAVAGFVVPHASPLGAFGFSQEKGGRIYRFRRSTTKKGPVGEIAVGKRTPASDVPSSYFEGKEFHHERIAIDDKHFHDCTFIGCQLVYSGGNVPMFTGDIVMDEMKLEFDDAAERTIHLLGRLAIDPYGEEMVRKYIEAILFEATERRGRQVD